MNRSLIKTFIISYIRIIQIWNLYKHPLSDEVKNNFDMYMNSDNTYFANLQDGGRAVHGMIIIAVFESATILFSCYTI